MFLITRLYRPKRLLIVTTLFIILLLLLVLRYTTVFTPTIQPKNNIPLIIWWDALPSDYNNARYCNFHLCRFSTDRQLLSQAKAILFYGSNVTLDDFPLPRLPHHLWALIHEESPRNLRFISHESVLQHFNFTSTFSRYSDFPLTLQYLTKVEDLTSPTYMVPIGEKSVLRTSKNLAPIAFLQSDCFTSSGREAYVKELMQYIQIDSYGKCLNNRKLPVSLTKDYLNNLDHPELYRFLARYKFIIAFENGVCHDYITEKYWRPLVIGSIPIYFGSPTVRDWEPNKKSVIHIADFSSPQALASFINELDSNDTEYNTYLNHKYDQLTPISNKHLQHELEKRNYPIHKSGFYFDFECAVCHQMHEMLPQQTQMATINHYNCPLPPAIPPMEHIPSSSRDWQSIMAMGSCEANILNNFLQLNINYTKHEFDAVLRKQIEANQCN